ncbi:hypothetical protein [Lacinutrix sp.]|nr:hypothetical protein [Lacinutrix sp.]
MKTQKQTIEFRKSTIIELEANKMNNVKGGSLSPVLPLSVITITR